MNGAEVLIRTAVQAGIKVCFTNPGTTEIPLVLAIDSEPGMKGILGLFEGVCTGAADGYARMLEKPALTLLHLGPGFANGVSNLHNARKARTPILNIVGEHTTWHRDADAPLHMDIESLASTVSGWYKTNQSPQALSKDTAEAIGASMYGQISTLIIPNDYQAEDCSGVEIATPQFSFNPVDSEIIDKAAKDLRGNKKTALIMGDKALRERGLQAAARIKAATGCDLITDHLPSYMDRGAGLPDAARVPFAPNLGVEMLSKYETILLAGTKEPVTFFGFKGFSSYFLREDQKKISIASNKQDAATALEQLATTLNAPPISKVPGDIFAKAGRPSIPQGELTPEKSSLTIAALQPEDAIIVDEGITTTLPYYPLTAGVPRHSFLTTVGGSIGYGMPNALGASVACPDRPVINLQADGSAMYTVQALWTQAREALNITTLICSNRSYNILKMELARSGIDPISPEVSSLLDLQSPDIGWVTIAEGMGVPAVAVSKAEDLAREFQKALSEPGPHLIEMVISRI